MLPMIGVPTTAGTGSEAQSYALISDPKTHQKMACGDPKAAFRAVILDPRLTLTQPAAVTAAAGYDAIAHAVESFVCTKRNPASIEICSRGGVAVARGPLREGARVARRSRCAGCHAARCPLCGDGDRALDARRDPRVREPADGAIRHDPRRRHRVMLPHVVRWNGDVAGSMYEELRHMSSAPTDALATRLSDLAAAGGLPKTLREAGASRGDLPALAREASEQWTGRFNPRPFDTAGAREVYECAF